MTHRLTTNYAKNYCNRTLIVKVIVENVVTCFFLGHGVVSVSYQLVFSQFVKRRSVDYTSVCGDVYIVLCVCGHVK